MNGALRSGAKIRVMSTGRSHVVDKLGRFAPKPVTRESLETGEVGFVVAGIKEIDGAPVGDTITLGCESGEAGVGRLQASAAARVRRALPGEFG